MREGLKFVFVGNICNGSRLQMMPIWNRVRKHRDIMSFSRALKRLVTDYFKSERLLQFIMRTSKELWLERSTLS